MREKNEAGKKHSTQRRLPGHVHFEADGVGEVGVQAHARRERNRIARDNAHQDRRESRRKACGRSGCRQRQPGVGQDGRVHQHDVGHGEERRDAGQNLSAPVSPQAGKFKVGFESLEHRRVCLEKHRAPATQRKMCAQTAEGGALSAPVRRLVERHSLCTGRNRASFFPLGNPGRRRCPVDPFALSRAPE